MILMLLLLSTLQQPTVTANPVPNVPFQIAFDSDNASTPSFRWWCDGAILKNFAPGELTMSTPANADGTFTFTGTVPGLTAGTHVCLVSAFNANGENKSAPSSVVAGTVVLPGQPPMAPIRLRIVVTVGGGGSQ